MTEEDLNRQITTIINGAVLEFIRAWHAAPLLWLEEIDVQCTLASKIRAGLEATQNREVFTIEACHPSQGYTGVKTFSRLVCEPYVKHPMYHSGAHPDIVVWGNAPGGSDIGSGEHPIFWACEIKYTDHTPDKSDVERLTELVAKKPMIVRHACALMLVLHLTEDEMQATEVRCQGKDGQIVTSAVHMTPENIQVVENRVVQLLEVHACPK